jgi:hypothetical protein
LRRTRLTPRHHPGAHYGEIPSDFFRSYSALKKVRNREVLQ